MTVARAAPHSVVRPSPRSAWLLYTALAGGVAALLLTFNHEALDAVTVWNQSTAYNHCFLIIPIVIFLLWDRRRDLVGFTPEPAPALGLLAVPLALAWFAAERIGFMEGRQLIAMTGIELLFLAVLGPRGFRRLLGPLLYLYFLVPFGDFLTGPLQHFTTWFVMHGLDLLGIPNFTDGVTIQIPEGTFVIAQACAGLRFLIAAVAFACLYALVIYRSPLRRAMFIGVSLFVPIIANGLRALGIVCLGHILGSAQAAETDHILYGWIFFSIVLLILIMLGLPFREDGASNSNGRALASQATSTVHPGRAATAALITVGLLCAAPAAVAGIDASLPPPTRAPRFAIAPPCDQIAQPGSAPEATPEQPTGRQLLCDGLGLTLYSETFAARTPARPILKEQERLAGLSADEVNRSVIIAHGLRWQIERSPNPPAMTASLIWTAGRVVNGGLDFRLKRAWQSLMGGGGPVILLALTAEKPLDTAQIEVLERQKRAVTTFLRSQKDLPAALEAAAHAPGR